MSISSPASGRGERGLSCGSSGVGGDDVSPRSSRISSSGAADAARTAAKPARVVGSGVSGVEEGTYQGRQGQSSASGNAPHPPGGEGVGGDGAVSISNGSGGGNGEAGVTTDDNSRDNPANAGFFPPKMDMERAAGVGGGGDSDSSSSTDGEDNGGEHELHVDEFVVEGGMDGAGTSPVGSSPRSSGEIRVGLRKRLVVYFVSPPGEAKIADVHIMLSG